MENEIEIINKLLPEFEVKKLDEGELLLTGDGARYYIHIEPLERRFGTIPDVVVSKEVYLAGDYWTPSDVDVFELALASSLTLALRTLYLDYQSDIFEKRCLTLR